MASIFQNTCKPEGKMGKLMVSSMNIGHKSLHEWGFKQLDIKPHSVCLDIGCGGGTNLKRLLDIHENTQVYGIDYSDICVEKSIKKCSFEVKCDRCHIKKMNVQELDFPDNKFDIVTAFETIYFWGDLNNAFQNIYRVLKEDGEFFICNESNGKDKNQEKWTKIIEGMKLYKIEEIKDALVKAGFKEIIINDEYKNWLSISAIK